MLHIIDILRGAKNQRIVVNKHDQLSTYGIGKDKTVDEWRMLGRSLLHQGLIEQTADGYSILKLNALSWEVMRKQRPVSIAVPIAKKTNWEEGNVKAADVEVLMQKLRSLRKELADEQAVPPYVIFHDSTLKLMAQSQPKTLDEFGNLSGVGSHKLSQYGERFLAEIQRYRQEQGLQEKTIHRVISSPHSHSPSDTELTTLELYNQGLSIENIAKQRNVKTATIINHLSNLIEKKQPVDLSKLVPLERQKKIWNVLEIVGDIALTPIRENLGESYSFDEIRLVRAKWRREKQKTIKDDIDF
jgi:ATP-dependent DNA helicase RecQ